MKERPILFSAPMVRAILDSTKTQTRRIIKPQPTLTDGCGFSWKGFLYGSAFTDGKTKEHFVRQAAPWNVGDRLWVRETWSAHWMYDSGKPSDIPNDGESLIMYDAGKSFNHECMGQDHFRKKRPSIFMPRWASRINLEITGIGVERLNDISEEDAIREGIKLRPSPRSGFNECWDYQCESWADPIFFRSISSYRTLWESINGAGSWNLNPWVWVIEFKRI